MTPSVTIVGAGLGGLLLARVLHVRGIPAVVYDADPRAGSRTQGGQLDIHEHDGQAALAAAGLTAQFRNIVHQGGEATRVLEPDGTVLLDRPDDGTGTRPEVLRGDLRQILLEALPEGAVQWNRKVIEVHPVGDGTHRLMFADGHAVDTGLLVGADGAWSKVRSLVSPATPAYTGAVFVETYLHDVDVRHPEPAAAVGQGAMYALTPGKGIVAHREAGAVVHTYVMLQRPAGWADNIDRARLAAEFDGWAPQLRALIADSDTVPVPRHIYELPDTHRWQRVPGVTLLGDAAHLMPPSGDGANLAMFDGARLADAIATHPHDVESALAAFEDEMFTRSASVAVGARETMKICLGSGSPHGLLELLAG